MNINGLFKWIIIIALIAAVVFYFRADAATQDKVKSQINSIVTAIIGKTKGLVANNTISSTSTDQTILGKIQTPQECTTNKECIIFFGRNDAQCNNITGECYVE